MNGPFSSRNGMVYDRFDNVIAIMACGWENEGERVAADLNLADSIHAEPRIETTLALHRRDGGETIRASAEFCAACLPVELHDAIDRGDDAAKLLNIRRAEVIQMRRRP